MSENIRDVVRPPPVLREYFGKLSREDNILLADCELIVIGVIVYASDKNINFWDAAYSKNEVRSGIMIDLMLTDGFHFRKVFFCPNNRHDGKINASQLHAGTRIMVQHCSLNFDATIPGFSFIAVHRLEILGDGSIPNIDELDPDPHCVTSMDFIKNFIPILSERILSIDVWFNNIPRFPPEEMYRKETVDIQKVLKLVTKGPYLRDLFNEFHAKPFPARPLIVRVVSKGNVFLSKSEVRPSCPCQALFRIRDMSGVCCLTLFHEANVIYNRIREGTLLYITDYYVKIQDPANLPVYNVVMNTKARYSQSFPMEILVKPSILKNRKNVTSLPVNIIEGGLEDIVCPYIPPPTYSFLRTDCVSSLVGLIDVVGIVIGISRYARRRNKDNELTVTRWIEIACLDPTPKIIAVFFPIRQQVAEHVHLRLGELVVLTDLQCKKLDSVKAYFESTLVSQIIGFSRKIQAKLSRYVEFQHVLKLASQEGYVERLLEEFGWLSGHYNLFLPDCYDKEKPFLPKTDCENWGKIIQGLTTGETIEMLVECSIVRVFRTDISTVPFGNLSQSCTEICKVCNETEEAKHYFGRQFPHKNTFPVYYDTNTYIKKLEDMQFPPMDIDEWCAKQERMKHPCYKPDPNPTFVPVSYLTMWLQGVSGKHIMSCFFPYCATLQPQFGSSSLKTLLASDAQKNCSGSKAVVAERSRQQLEVEKQMVCGNLNVNVEEVLQGTVTCLVNITRMDLDPAPEIILRRAFWD